VDEINTAQVITLLLPTFDVWCYLPCMDLFWSSLMLMYYEQFFICGK